jgi:hypothetical protein
MEVRDNKQEGTTSKGATVAYSPEDKAEIYEGNARRLLRLKRS